ncbi:MAG: hypothetical protein HND53_09210 [Proteobacteria bacterium]|nr:hypothetical protein [Pseudomonadota bacterium]NOG60664.1 hypothetical protein [Pseudomonadota bacterium]
MTSLNMKKIFDKTVDIVFGVILLFITLGLIIGTVQLFVSVWSLFFSTGITGQYVSIITDVLTLYVLVELSRSLVEYFNSGKFRLTYIVDAAIVFVIREILIGLFKHQLEPDALYAITFLLLVLGALRISSILVHQREKTLEH